MLSICGVPWVIGVHVEVEDGGGREVLGGFWCWWERLGYLFVCAMKMLEEDESKDVWVFMHGILRVVIRFNIRR